MELSVTKTEEGGVVVLLDSNMRIVKPVQDYLNQHLRELVIGLEAQLND